MISYKKLACFLFTFLLLSLPMFGQTQYFIWEFLNGQVDNLSWCSTGSNACLIDESATGGSPALVQMSSGPDGTLMGVDSSGYVWIFTQQTDYSFKWIKQTGSNWNFGVPVASIHDGGNGELVALTTATAGNIFLSLDGGTSWTQMGSTWWCSDAATDGNQDIWCIGVSGNVYLFNASTGWNLSTTSGATIAVAIDSMATAQSGGLALLVDTSANLHIFENGTWSSFSTPYTPATSKGSVGIGTDGSIALLGSEGNVRVSHDLGSTWYEPNLSSTSVVSLADSARGLTFVLGTAGHVRHLNDVMPVFEIGINGTVHCNALDGACPNTTQHTVKAGLTLPTQFGTGSNSVTAPSTTAFHVTYQDEDPNCDPFAPGGDDCQPTEVPVTTCPIVGVISEVIDLNEQNPVSAVLYLQRYKVTSIIAGPKNYGDAYQWYVSVQQWCSNGYWQPWLNNLLVEAHTNTLPIYWDVGVYELANGTGNQSGAIPSTDGTNKKSNCTGSYSIPSI